MVFRKLGGAGCFVVWLALAASLSWGIILASGDVKPSWHVVEEQQSRSGNEIVRQEVLQLQEPPYSELVGRLVPNLVAAGAGGAVAAFATIAVVALHQTCRLDGLFLVVLMVSAGFLLWLVTARHLAHSLFPPAAARLATMLSAPPAFWGSVNGLAVVTRVVSSVLWLLQKLASAYARLDAGVWVDRLTRWILVWVDRLQKVTPSLTQGLLARPQGPCTSLKDWACSLQALSEEHFNPEAYEDLARRIREPELPVLTFCAPLSSALELLEGLSQTGPGAAHRQLLLEPRREARTKKKEKEGSFSREAEVPVEWEAVTLLELLRLPVLYFLCLLAAASDHLSAQLWLRAALFTPPPRADARAEAEVGAEPRMGTGTGAVDTSMSETVRWCLISDQFAWYGAQHISVTDVAVRMLACSPESASALQVWLLVDSALAKMRLLPGLWYPPAKRAQVMRDRSAVVAALVAAER